MSLINEALKKAQRQRTDPPSSGPDAATAPLPQEAAPSDVSFRRAPARRGAPVLLLGAGGAVLVVLSVVATVFLLNRPEPALAKVTPPPPAVEPAASPATALTAPAITLPAIAQSEPSVTSSAPAADLSPPVAATPAVVPPSPAVEAVSPTLMSGAATATTAAPVATTAAPASSGDGKPDPRVSTFVDAIRVAGIRSSGNESRVLMNDRVYRVNDIVERTLAIRLTKVEPEALTFVDTNGIIYVKNF